MIKLTSTDSRAAAMERFKAAKQGKVIPPPPVTVVETDGDNLQDSLTELLMAAHREYESRRNTPYLKAVEI